MKKNAKSVPSKSSLAYKLYPTHSRTLEIDKSAISGVTVPRSGAVEATQNQQTNRVNQVIFTPNPVGMFTAIVAPSSKSKALSLQKSE